MSSQQTSVLVLEKIEKFSSSTYQVHILPDKIIYVFFFFKFNNEYSKSPNGRKEDYTQCNVFLNFVLLQELTKNII